jgi:hypothetical protein
MATEIVLSRQANREDGGMSQAPTVWMLTDHRAQRLRRQRVNMLLVAALLCVMTTAEVLFLNFVAGPDTVATMMAAEGVASAD